MKNIKGIIIWINFILILSTSVILGQGKPYEGPDDSAGDIAAEREGYMSGNRVYLYFQNTTELAKWVPNTAGSQWSRWPNNFEGVRMLDGVGLLIGAKVYVKNDTIPEDDPIQIITNPNLDELYFLQTSYREEMDTNPTGDVEWGLYPVFGYFNENSENPAMSNRPNSWPTGGWPSTGSSTKWPGEWNGRFGRGVVYADMEAYFVANDAQDQEYLGPEDIVKYYPMREYDASGNIISDLKIGDRNSQVSIQNGLPWGGLGIRVSQRGFQWNNPQARDAIFWEYSVANVSKYNLTEVAFGYWVDNGIGNDTSDELGFFDKTINMAYSWDINGIGEGGLPTGTMGFAYLESPGIYTDFLDNDDDGLTDERRDNDATTIIGPTDGITDITKFLAAYNLELSDLRPHWDADEDQDWEDGIDTNGDGIYQSNEFAGDDVGLDGVGPAELNYPGPDFGEGNHQPDFQQGIGCEPNFNATDVTESDMVGLTSFRLFRVPDHSPPYTNWFRNDESFWDLIGQDSLARYLGNISNLIETFASGPFPLVQGSEERISMSELHSYDPLAGLNSEPDHSAPALYEQKRIVQVIYEKDYRFAQPPKMPTLSATPGDGKVVLTWDNVSDTRTRDPFLGNINDFEGYKLFRTSDPKLQDAEIITDGYGTPVYKQPIFQCDKKDTIEGFTDFGLVNGVAYYLGNESGIVHHFIDNTVQNGRTYYYALVAYDYGAPDIGPGIAPSENNAVIELDESENIRVFNDGTLAIGQNVAIVTPHQIAAGYVPPSIEKDDNNFVLGTGSITPEIMATGQIKENHVYKIKFDLDTLVNVNNYDHGMSYTNSGVRVYDQSDSNRLVYSESPNNYTYDNLVYDDTLDYWAFKNNELVETDVFDGLRLKMDMSQELAAWDGANTRWVPPANAPISVIPTVKESYYFPWDYNIIFTNNDSAYTGQVTSVTNVRDENNARISGSRLLTRQSFNFYVVNKSFLDSTGSFEKLDLIVHDVDDDDEFDLVGDRILAGPITSTGRWAGTAFIIQLLDSTNLPQPNDEYEIAFRRPFWSSDSITFTVTPEGVTNQRNLKNTMDSIKVVPNPYIMTNSMESAILNPNLNQDRKIMFTHLPAKCEIKIFTSSGMFVDKIIVNNPAENGIIHWDLQTSENLEIAAGIYIYHIKADVTGDVKLGKFAVIK